MEIIKQYLPLLIPVALIQLGLMVTALVDLIRRSQTRGPKWAWALVIVLINFIGPIIYFIVGRKEE
jgi:Phospholipase_D-nuclease N-terminal